MKERIFTTKEQGRVLVETGLPISTASGHRSCGVDRLYSMEDNAGRVSLAEVVTPDVSNPWRTLGSHYGGYAYVKVKNRQTDVKIDWKLLRAIEKS